MGGLGDCASEWVWLVSQGVACELCDVGVTCESCDVGVACGQ